MRIDGPQITGSFNLNGDTIGDLDVFATTSSFNLMTASMATTGSNVFKGTQTSSGSIIPSVNNTYDLGSPTHQFRHVYISTGSLYIDGTRVLGSTSSELQITTDVGQSFKIIETGADTITLQSNDGNVTLTSTGGGDIIMDPSTGVIGLKGTVTIYTGNKITSSDGNAIQFGNGIAITGSIVATGTNLISGSSQITYSGLSGVPSDIISGSGQLTTLGVATTGSNTFNGNLTVTGFIDTQELRTTYISSSILYRSGSTKFGDELTDTHAFTGSLLVSGSISVPSSGLVSGSSQVSYTGLSNVPSGIVSGSSQVLNASGVWSGSAQLPSGVVSGSAQLPSGLISGSAQLPSGTVSGSAQISFTGTTGYSTYINQALLTTSNSTFNSVTSGDIRYNGTGYITYDVANSGTNSLVVRKFGTTVLTLNSSGYLGVNVDPSFYLDVQSNVANSFYTIAQFENKDYTSGTRSFIRVRNWVNAGGSYSSYFGTGRDSKTYIIANDSARGGDIVIDGGNGNVGINDANPSQKLTVAGSIRINQDAALRAGSGDNWLIGQDSGTNLIHIGSAGVANDIRFDSSTGSGIVMIKANARLGVNTIDPAVTFDVNGYMGLRSNNYFYFGHTTSNIGGWTTRMYADGSTHKFNANGFAFNNEGYGSTTWLSINSSGNSTFTSTSGGRIVRIDGPSNTDNYLSLHSGTIEMFIDADTTNSSGIVGTQSSHNLILRTAGSNKVWVAPGGNMGVGIASPQQKLSVDGSIRAHRSIYNWYQAGTNSWDGFQFLHLKTDMWAGGAPNGNTEYTMSLFYGRLYSYSSAYVREGHFGFHNWSGGIYQSATNGTFWSGGYTSSDGYVVLVVALGQGTYMGITIDWHQAYGYPLVQRTVTASSPSNSATGVY
jgi:hypothetical protein